MQVTKKCKDLAVGGSTYIECDSVSQSNNVTRRMGAIARLPADMQEMRFTCQTFTAIAIQSGEVSYLNKVTRTQ